MKLTKNIFFTKAASAILVAALMVTMAGFANQTAEADEMTTNIQETTEGGTTTEVIENTTQQQDAISEKDVLLTLIACANADIYLSYEPCKAAFDRAIEIAACATATTLDINQAIKELAIMMAEAVKEAEKNTEELTTKENVTTKNEVTTKAPVTVTTTSNTTVGKANVTSVTNVKGKKAKIILKKISGVKYYQIKYSTSKKFKSSTTVVSKNLTYTIKKLKKGNTYYIKARAYKTVKGRRNYGAWSKVKKITIKK